jgi:gluconate 2-dehydrogenase gamma chain
VPVAPDNNYAGATPALNCSFSTRWKDKNLLDGQSQCVQKTARPGASRRSFVAGATFGAIGFASPLTISWQVLANGLEPVPPNPSRTPVFFTASERTFVAAATSRLIPTDDSGPGAAEADVATFIDRQLAGPYGRGEGWYLGGPFPAGNPEQGWQSELSPAQIYRTAIPVIDAHCTRTFSGKPLAKLSAEQQDSVMRGLQKGEIVLEGLLAKTFFQLLHQNTVEAYFSDPVYGGNRNFVGWRMIGYPGVRYDWRPWIARHGSRVDWPVVGLYGPGDHFGLRNP